MVDTVRLEYEGELIKEELKDIKVPFTDDLEEVMLARYREIQREPLSDYTKATRVNIVKGFLKWLNDGYPPRYLRKMRTSNRRMKPVRKGDSTLGNVRGTPFGGG